MSHHLDKNIEPFNVTVTDIHHFATFKDALENLPIEEILPIENITVESGVDIYLKYVSLETQMKDGVVMLKVSNN